MPGSLELLLLTAANFSSHIAVTPAVATLVLFSAVNCLTVVFHQHEAGQAGPAAPAGGEQLRRPALTAVFREILDHVDSYGGVLAALVATFLSDVMNHDPQVVHYVHSSGLAKAFLALMTEPPEAARAPEASLLMAVPNVLMALALTEAGARAVAAAAPFPALLAVFTDPAHAMPQSRCLLNELAAIVGTGLDELMRHNPGLRPACLRAAVGALQRTAALGQRLTAEEGGAAVGVGASAGGELATRRTQLMQFAYNVTQLIEQILHNEDHVSRGHWSCRPLRKSPGGVDSQFSVFSSPCIADCPIRRPGRVRRAVGLGAMGRRAQRAAARGSRDLPEQPHGQCHAFVYVAYLGGPCQDGRRVSCWILCMDSCHLPAV